MLSYDWLKHTRWVSEMPRKPRHAGAAIFAAVLLLHAAAAGYAPQNAPPAGAEPPAGQPGAAMSPQQLDDLVAPIALYPDPVVGELLAASTYPIEIAEAEQWLRDHPKWKPSKLMDEAKKQNWDPSIQGLVAFPDVLARLTQDTNWTTQLGNAFLAQQADVMQAVQRMRARAQANGRLQSTPQETVTTENQNGQTAINIQPANPDEWYVPNYNPAYVWGAPGYGAYPPLLYPGIDVGFDWYPGIDLGLYFGGWGGWGWGGWGWAPNWYGGNIYMDHSFFNRYGFRGYGGGGRLGNSVWAHNPEHRLGMPYANRAVANRYAGNRAVGGGGAGRFGGGTRTQNSTRGEVAPQQRFGNSGFEQRGSTANHSVFGGYQNGGMSRMQSDRGFSSMGAGRTFGGGGGMRGGGFGGGGGAHGGGRR
jgi:hypothetical protein